MSKKPRYKKRKKFKNKKINADKKLQQDKDDLIAEAYHVHAKLGEKVGYPALDAFHTFSQRLCGNPPEGEEPLTLKAAQDELQDKVKFAQNLVKAERKFKANEDARVSQKTNDGIEIVIEQTAKEAAVGIAFKVGAALLVASCLVSPVTNRLIDPFLDKVGPKVSEQFSKAKEVCRRAIKYTMASPPRAPKIPNKKGRNAPPNKKATP